MHKLYSQLPNLAHVSDDLKPKLNLNQSTYLSVTRDLFFMIKDKMQKIVHVVDGAG